MKKIILAIAMVPLFLAPALMAQGKTPGADKIKITGGTIFYASSPYLSIYANLTRMGAPLLHAKVRLNQTLLQERSGGYYSGAFLTPYNIALGDEHVFTIELPLLSSPPPLETFPAKRAELAAYRVDKLIKWVFPAPGEVIRLSAQAPSIRLRWLFIGTPVRVRITVGDLATRNDIFSGMTALEEIALPAGILQPGKTYTVQIDTKFPGCGPLGLFTLAPLAAPGSEVKFDWVYYFRFSTAPGPVIF